MASRLRSLRDTTTRSATVFAKDVGHGLLEVSHNSLALLGLILVALLIFGATRDGVRHQVEVKLFGWLQARHEARLDPADLIAQQLVEPGAVARATAFDPKQLTRQQLAVAHWISRRYRVAPEPISRLVKEAWHVGAQVGLEPTLILAIMAIESSFNPFAQSPVGAQGLMQVMTRIHDDKYEPFGGTFAAFDPVTNLRVGVQVLKECITRAGSLEAGLRYYVGAANLDSDGGYAAKVLAEQARLRMVAGGRTVALNDSGPVATGSAPAQKVTPAITTPADSLADAALPQRLALNR
ncbi:lytic transglycosylase domain-containing protein [Piscinibacter sakaiensis]|uniref:lytic transglycosylase domain-containing protein n=1 Tax=Piscinibacter sakaiensis TaxID=1547922 RepID=UPI003AACC703